MAAGKPVYQAEGGSLAGKLSSTVMSCALSISRLRLPVLDQITNAAIGSVTPKRK